MISDADAIEKAADMLESGILGWHQGSSYLFQGGKIVSACAGGAVCQALGADVVATSLVQVPTFQKVDDACKHKHGEPLVDWNDDPSRTKEEVIAFLKETAKDLRNRATPSSPTNA